MCYVLYVILSVECIQIDLVKLNCESWPWFAYHIKEFVKSTDATSAMTVPMSSLMTSPNVPLMTSAMTTPPCDDLVPAVFCDGKNCSDPQILSYCSKACGLCTSKYF